jgi:hypothetical protein
LIDAVSPCEIGSSSYIYSVLKTLCELNEKQRNRRHLVIKAVTLHYVPIVSDNARLVAQRGHDKPFSSIVVRSLHKEEQPLKRLAEIIASTLSQTVVPAVRIMMIERVPIKLS